MEDKELFTDKITRGNCTYFFDIKKAENDALYLSISESKRIDKGFDKYQILIFDEDIREFRKGFDRVVKEMSRRINSNAETRSYILDDIRKEYPQAYRPWSISDDEKLEILFCEGKTVRELARVFGRQEGAINSRIRKLELREKYG